MQKRTKIGLLIGGPALAITAASVAYAASVTLTSSTLTAGTTVVAACQTTGTIAATYTTNDTAGTGFKITAVNLSGIDSVGCTGRAITVVASDGTATNLGSGSAAVSGSTAIVTLSPSVLESAVIHLDIEIK